MDTIRTSLLCFLLAGCGGTTGDVLSGGDAGTDLPLADLVPGDAIHPTVVIFHPGDNEVRAANMPVPFVGHATDAQGAMLTGGSLVWTSNLDMQIGTGEMFSATLSPGVHTITLTATDSVGLRNSASITLTLN